jgi:hypothetical protein
VGEGEGNGMGNGMGNGPGEGRARAGREPGEGECFYLPIRGL